MPRRPTLSLYLLIAVPFYCQLGWAEKFEWHELPGTGAGYDMDAARFAYQSLHETIQTANIDGNGFRDVVVLADGALPQTDDYLNAGGFIDNGHYLWNFGGNGKESPNVRAGNRGDPYGIHIFVGSDLVWYLNDGFGHFFPFPITPGGLPPTIYHGKTMNVWDLDGDGDDDIVVWCSSGYLPTDVALGARKVAWFENRRVPDGMVGRSPRFLQHDVLIGNFVSGGTTFWGSNPRGGTLADMDGDGRRDLVVLNHSTFTVPVGQSNLFWFRNTGSSGAGLFDSSAGNVSAVNYRDPFGIVVVAADVDNNGRTDLVVAENGVLPNDRQLTFYRDSGLSFLRTTVRNNFFVAQSLAVGDLFPGGCREIVAGGQGISSVNSPISVFSRTLCATAGAWTQSILPGAPAENGFVWDVQINNVNNDPDNRPDVLAFFTSTNTAVANALTGSRVSSVTAWANDNNVASAWRPFSLLENRTLPPMTLNQGGGLALADFDIDGDVDVLRSHMGTNLGFFENTWNTERNFQLRSTAVRQNMRQVITSFFSVKPDRSLGPLVGQEVESR